MTYVMSRPVRTTLLERALCENAQKLCSTPAGSSAFAEIAAMHSYDAQMARGVFEESDAQSRTFDVEVHDRAVGAEPFIEGLLYL
jgi:hypothetical protein